MENSTTTLSPSHEQIAALAEKIYIESGCIPGRDLENWLQAEEQLKRDAEKARQPSGNGKNTRELKNKNAAKGRARTTQVAA